MPRRSRRRVRAENLMNSYMKFRKARAKRFQRRARLLRRELDRAGVLHHSSDDSDNLASSSSPSSHSPIDFDFESNSDGSSDGTWSSLLGSNWRGRSGSRSQSSATSESSEFWSSLDIDMDMPDLLPPGSLDSDDEDSNDSDDGMEGSDSGEDADDEDWSSEDMDTAPLKATRIGRSVRDTIQNMYAKRYEMPRNTLPRGPAYLPHVLNVLKLERPDHFRQELRVTPITFDKILTKILDNPVFANNSQNEQMPVEDQLAIALYRFGHDGNAASLDKVAKWSGYSKGTVVLATRRVMTAVLCRDFMDEAVSFPTAEEKEKAKRWVEAHSCKAWRDGWCLVDGTLIPLYDRPYWYGESYFDRKCNYSLNVQIISMPNLRIIDFGYGFTGSTHDSTAWEETRLLKEHGVLLDHGEFIWADSAYPIEVWLIAPYKKPERDLPENEEFNNHVSMVRIRSEHAIGFLKGRFHSLKGLRVNIKDECSHKFATYWVVACIGIHSFAMCCEEDERNGDGDVMADPFIAEGLSSTTSDSDSHPRVLTQRNINGPRSLQAAKARRQRLKELLFRAKEKRARRQAERESSLESSDTDA